MTTVFTPLKSLNPPFCSRRGGRKTRCVSSYLLYLRNGSGAIDELGDLEGVCLTEREEAVRRGETNRARETMVTFDT